MRYVLSVNGDTLRDQNTRFSQLLAAYVNQADDPNDVRPLGGMQVDVPATLAESVTLPDGIDESDIVTIAEVTESSDEETPEASTEVDDMTVDQLREHAAEHDIDLGDAHLKVDILNTIKSEA